MIRRIARAIAAATVLVALVIGVPTLLVRFGHWPLQGMPTLGDMGDAPGQALTDTAMFGVLTLAAWVAWAAFTASVLLELIAELRGAPRPHLPLPTSIQAGARRLVASLLMTATITGPLAGHRVGAIPALPPLGPSAERASAGLVIEHAPYSAAPNGDVTQPVQSMAELPTVVVSPGDTPWSLAEHHLGDGLRWREIWEINRGRPQPDGRAWLVEDQIDTGWQLHLPTDATNLSPQPATEVADRSSEPPAPGIHVVVPGDTLREISEARLGDPERYEEIFEASTAIEQTNGMHLADPDLILPGWTLQVPADATPPPPPADPPSVRAEELPQATTSTVDETPTTSAPDPHAPPPTHPAPAPGPDHAAQPDDGVDPLPVSAVEADQDDDTSILSALAAPLVGITGATVLATGLGLTIRALRRRRSTTGAVGGLTVLHRKTPSVTELAVVRAGDLPLVRWAGQSLATMTAALDPRQLDGVPVAVELSEATGIEVLWDKPQPAAPDPWKVTDGGWAWRLTYDPDADVPADELPSAIPGLVTFGQRDGRQLLVNLEALGSLSIAGEQSTVESFVRSVVLELGTSEDLADAYVTLIDVDTAGTNHLDRVSTGNGGEAIEAHAADEQAVDAALGDVLTTFAYRAGPAGTHLEASVLVLAATDDHTTEDAITASAANHGVATVILGAAPHAAAQLTIEPGGIGHLEPLGLTFNAAGVPEATADQIQQLLDDEAAVAAEGLDESAAEEWDRSPESDGSPSSDDAEDSIEAEEAEVLAAVGQPINGHSAIAPVIDLRVHERRPPTSTVALIGQTVGMNGHTAPSIDQSEEPASPQLMIKVLGAPHIPDRPDLSRREVVLAAYLACHDGPATTSGLQDGIWNGRAVQAKTFWNLITRTRRGLGNLADGTPVLPPADRINSTLSLSPGVTTDLEVLRRSYEHALGSSSAEAIPLLRNALELIEGPPFDAAGYDWAHHTHQYVADAAALIEQATDHLVRLAQDDGDTDLARRAIVQGLRALPGNEVLYRLRMTVEQHAGNLTGVKAAYNELVNLLAELESGPTDATRSLFEQLSRPALR